MPAPAARPDPSGSGAGDDEVDRLVVDVLRGDRNDDLYATYDRLRADHPRHRATSGPFWALTAFDDCHAVLRDRRFGKGDARVEEIFGVLGGTTGRELRTELLPSLLFLNPPDHTRVRALVNKAFTPLRVEALRPRIVALTDALLDAIPVGEPVDVMEALAFPLPMAVIGELVGVPPADRDVLRHLFPENAKSLELGATPEEVARAKRAALELISYFGALVRARRAEPADDLTSAVIAAREGDDRLSRREIVGTLLLLFGAGFETTMGMIGNVLHTLLRHPDQLAAVRADRSLVGSAVEEVLRYETTTQVAGRVALEPADIGGQPVAPGDWMLCFLGAANRDPAQFADPAAFRVDRSPNHHLSFSTGAHHCLGAPLARLELAVVLERLLDRFGTIDLVEAPRLRPGIVLRAPETLRVRFAP